MAEIATIDKFRAVVRIARYRPVLTTVIVLLSFVTALLEGIGLSFLIPIIEIAQAEGDPAAEADGVLGLFLTIYQTLGIPFTLEFVIAGVAAVMTIRYTSSFLVAWLREALRVDYVRTLQIHAFEAALDARVQYFDEHGSDEILNGIVTQAEYAGKVIRQLVKVCQLTLLCTVYFAIAFYLAPVLTLITVFVLGMLNFVVRDTIESAFSVGDRVASANEQIQEAVQAGTQGIRDVKLFGMDDELYRDFRDGVDQFKSSSVALYRNESAVQNFLELSIALVIFLIIYAALTVFPLSLAALGVFLLAMFQLAPRLSSLNQQLYRLEGDLPHLIRTEELIESLESQSEPNRGVGHVPNIDEIRFDDVSFGYGDEVVLQNISFEISEGEFVGFVGQSGAGKSTIVSLLARIYEPDSGRIVAGERPIDEWDLRDWRENLAIVRQDPHIFNDTLKYNLSIGNRDVTQEEIEIACRAARVTEFVDELPNGYETTLGDDGVQLSGGQRQRVALARSLLKDAQVLVLDEATSDLDSTLEREIQREIEQLEGEYTIIAIAHRLSTITGADRIFTVEDGAIIEKGTHPELLENGGKYAELYSIQS